MQGSIPVTHIIRYVSSRHRVPPYWLVPPAQIIKAMISSNGSFASSGARFISRTTSRWNLRSARCMTNKPFLRNYMAAFRGREGHWVVGKSAVTVNKLISAGVGCTKHYSVKKTTVVFSMNFQNTVGVS